MVESISPRILLSRNMKRLRHHYGYSQEALAERVGCSVTMIGHVETLTKFPSPENLHRIAVSLDVTVSELFSDGTFTAGSIGSYAGPGAGLSADGGHGNAESGTDKDGASQKHQHADNHVRRLIRYGS